jgi:4-hydroxybutyrate CoA-transferase
MRDWQTIYRERLTTADEAVKRISNGSRVLFAHAVAVSQNIAEAMVRNAEHFSDVEICHWVTPAPCPYVAPEMEGHFRHNALFVGPNTRAAVAEGRADYTPMFFSDTPRFFADGTFPLDVTVLTVSPPDKHGFCSCGTAVCATKPGALSSGMIIADVNDQMPRTLGDSFLHVSEFTHIIESSRPLPEILPAELTEVERTIGAHCADLIQDGSTLQVGIGSLPDAVLLHLRDKKDLGIHSEMISDGVIELVEAGVITGAKKTVNPRKIVVGFLMGTKRLYDFVDDNPMIQMMTIDYVNSPLVIASHRQMVSINSCLQVDFCGQVNAESIGALQYSGIGGQVDFIRGASLSEGGKAILAMPSTAGNGRFSRIVATLDPGATVTTSRTDAHYIVTEYGVVNLRGKSLRQRAKELIGIAHPDFREGLERQFHERFARK